MSESKNAVKPKMEFERLLEIVIGEGEPVSADEFKLMKEYGQSNWLKTETNFHTFYDAKALALLILNRAYDFVVDEEEPGLNKSPEQKLELTPEERWNSQMNRSEALHEKASRIQSDEEQLLLMQEKQLDRMNQLLAKAEQLMAGTDQGRPADESSDTLGYGHNKLTIGTASHPNTKRDQQFKLYEQPEVKQLRADREDHLQIIKDLQEQLAFCHKRIEAAKKRGEMVREILSKDIK